jgi:thiol-disulfide isomerase/thioredoxin
MKLALLLSTLALPFASIAGEFPAGSPPFVTSLEAVTKASQASGKPAIVVFSASWCPPCQSMKHDVYPSAAVKPLHDQFVWAYLDVDDPANAAAAKKFGVNGIPHIQFLGKDGKKLQKQVGSSSPEDFAKLLKGVLKKTGQS